ncbi:MAG: esterase/lipase family protein, partial [Sciscionella sp.]
MAASRRAGGKDHLLWCGSQQVIGGDARSAGMRWLRRLAVLITAVTLCGLFAQVASAQSSTYAPLDRQGPALSVPAATLAGALHCTASVARSGREPALLIPGTTLTPEVNFSWNYQRAFAAQGRPYCTVRLPNHAMSDIQVSAEYVVNAISTMHARSHNRVQVVGFSQGGMIGRWGLRFWPDLRPMVDDLIGIDPSNHGTLDAYPICTVGCAPSIWQQQSGSAFTRALNSGAETFAGISYTQVYTP